MSNLECCRVQFDVALAFWKFVYNSNKRRIMGAAFYRGRRLLKFPDSIAGLFEGGVYSKINKFIQFTTTERLRLKVDFTQSSVQV